MPIELRRITLPRTPLNRSRRRTEAATPPASLVVVKALGVFASPLVRLGCATLGSVAGRQPVESVVQPSYQAPVLARIPRVQLVGVVAHVVEFSLPVGVSDPGKVLCTKGLVGGGVGRSAHGVRPPVLREYARAPVANRRRGGAEQRDHGFAVHKRGRRHAREPRKGRGE